MEKISTEMNNKILAMYGPEITDLLVEKYTTDKELTSFLWEDVSIEGENINEIRR